MYAYKYDHATGEYLGPCPLVSNPRRPDAPCLPAFSAPDAPPEVIQGEAVVRVGGVLGVWKIVEDHRGEVWYEPDTRQAVLVTELGPVPPGLVAEQPPDPPAEPELPVPPRPIDELVEEKRTEVLYYADETLNDAAYRYSMSERLTWPKQEAEATTLLADPAAPAPLLRAIAATRGVDVLALRDRVLANASTWEIVSGSIMGQQQRYEDQLAVAAALAETDPEAARAAIAAIVPVYTLQGAA